MRRISSSKLSKKIGEKGITALQLALDLGVHRDTIYGILNAKEGWRSVQDKTAVRLAGKLKCEIEELEAGPRDDVPIPADPVPPGLEKWWIRFDSYMTDRTTDFVGRRFVFDAIDRVVNGSQYPSAYIVIRGDPGIGKTSLLSQRIMDQAVPIHHFNVALQGITRPDQFLGNICARMIAGYRLSRDSLPDGFWKDGTLLDELLRQASHQASKDKPLVICVDAVDEVDRSSIPVRANPMFLPPHLPPHTYFVVTMRRVVGLDIQTSSHVEDVDLIADSPENRQDIREYIEEQLSQLDVAKWLAEHRLTVLKACALLEERSEGNFLYLRHILPTLTTRTRPLNAHGDLPQGLMKYYQQHWAHMRSFRPEHFEQVCEPVIGVLAASPAPITAQQIARLTGLQPRRIRGVLQEWREFLTCETHPGKTLRYRLYHSAFREFLAQEVEPDLKRFHRLISSSIDARIRRRKRS